MRLGYWILFLRELLRFPIFYILSSRSSISSWMRVSLSRYCSLRESIEVFNCFWMTFSLEWCILFIVFSISLSLWSRELRLRAKLLSCYWGIVVAVVLFFFIYEILFLRSFITLSLFFNSVWFLSKSYPNCFMVLYKPTGTLLDPAILTLFFCCTIDKPSISALSSTRLTECSYLFIFCLILRKVLL